MPLHDFECPQCQSVFEELHKANEPVFCSCGTKAKQLISALADWTGLASMTVQYATRRSTVAKDSHITATPKDTSFYLKDIPTLDTTNRIIRK